MEQNQDGVQAQTDGVGTEETQTQEVTAEQLEVMKQEIESLRAHNNKILSEKKKIQSSYNQFKEESDTFRINRLQEEGKTKEALEEALEKVNRLQSTLTKREKGYAERVAFGEVKAKAVEMGCVAPDDLIKVLNLHDDLQVNPETYDPNPDQVISMLEQAKKEKPHFFGSKAPTVATQRASNQVPQANTQKVDYMSMSDDDFNAILAKHANDKVSL